MPDERPPFVPMPPVNSYWAREMEFNILNWTDGPEKSWTIKGTLRLDEHGSEEFHAVAAAMTAATYAFENRLREDFPDCRGQRVETTFNEVVHPSHW